MDRRDSERDDGQHCRQAFGESSMVQDARVGRSWIIRYRGDRHRGESPAWPPQCLYAGGDKVKGE